jgi:plastocyanin
MFRLRLKFIVAGLLVLPVIVHATTDHHVGQKNKAFSTATLLIKPGDRVVFENDDQITHNVYSTQKGKTSFNLKAQAPGVSTSVTFANEGNFEVRCAFHPKMKLLVVVKQ